MFSRQGALTGFVTTAYALHALSALYPEVGKAPGTTGGTAGKGGLADLVGRTLRGALSGGAERRGELLAATGHASALVRAWALVGLGMHPSAGTAEAVAKALSAPEKPVREAAAHAMRQHLLDDTGWDTAIRIGATGDDRGRESVFKALQMRSDAVMSRSTVPWDRLTALMDRGMNVDRHPGVRAWAPKAAWPWWVWNPPARAGISAAWERRLLDPEPDRLVENALRYSSHALFIANGHRANGSGEHQYPELAVLVGKLRTRLDAPGASSVRLADRLAGIAATFHTWAGGDGGPGQMGYATPGSSALFGKAALMRVKRHEDAKDIDALRLGLEAATGIPHAPLTDFLVNYSLSGPESVRQLAAGAVSDPRSVRLAAVVELVGPQREQVDRGAREPGRRAQLSDPILDLWSKVNWDIPNPREQQRAFLDLLIPRFDGVDAVAGGYLADGLGRVMASNPDLHLPIVLEEYFPERFASAMEERYWLRSVGWILTFKGMLAATRGPAAPDDARLGAIRDRALQLFLDQLRPGADPGARATAIRMANQTALRGNPEVLGALRRLMDTEDDRENRKIIRNVLKQGNESFLPELRTALKRERHPSTRFDAAGEPTPTPVQLEDILDFRDNVLPELSRQKRLDQLSCLGCHGVPGRVPSLGLKPVDAFGYQNVEDLLFNYRQLQARVNLANIDRSKILRKPLNIQDGKEDGHQGGRRYNSPEEEGYRILRRWAQRQATTGATAR